MSGVRENTDVAKGGGLEVGIGFEELATRENLLRAWHTFARGKWHQRAVRVVAHRLHIGTYMRYNDDMVVIGNNKERVRGWCEAIQKFAAQELQLTIPPHKVVIVCMPGSTVDILGLCTDGVRTWLRPTTVHKAKARLRHHIATQSPRVLDVMCSYHGLGIEEYGEQYEA